MTELVWASRPSAKMGAGGTSHSNECVIISSAIILAICHYCESLSSQSVNKEPQGAQGFTISSQESKHRESKGRSGRCHVLSFNVWIFFWWSGICIFLLLPLTYSNQHNGSQINPSHLYKNDHVIFQKTVNWLQGSLFWTVIPSFGRWSRENKRPRTNAVPTPPPH